jgi:HEAT repeat protein
MAAMGDRRLWVQREAVLALAAMEQAAAPAVPAIAEKLDQPFVATAATYALGTIGGFTREVQDKIRANVRSEDRLLSTTSLWALANTHRDNKQLRAQVTERLIARLNDEDPFVRVAAARALAALPPEPEITGPIWEKALVNADETMIRHAIDSFVLLGPTGVSKLVAALKLEGVRLEILTALEQLGPEAAEATQALVGLIDDPDEEVARAAARVLAAIGPAAKSAVPALVHSLQQGEKPNSFMVVAALGRIGPDAAAARPILLELMEGSNPEMAMVSAWALIQIGPVEGVAPKAVPLLITALEAPEPIRRRAAAEALGRIGPPAKDAVQALQTATRDADPSVRAAAQEALQAIQA